MESSFEHHHRVWRSSYTPRKMWHIGTQLLVALVVLEHFREACGPKLTRSCMVSSDLTADLRSRTVTSHADLQQ